MNACYATPNGWVSVTANNLIYVGDIIDVPALDIHTHAHRNPQQKYAHQQLWLPLCDWVIWTELKHD
jgi:hypothetical protein